MKRSLCLLLLLACSGDNTTAPDPTATSGDYGFEASGPASDFNGFQPGSHAWADSGHYLVLLNGKAVHDAPVRYRVTLGRVFPEVDTSDAKGLTEFLWGIGVESHHGTGELFACVPVGAECAETRLVAVTFPTP